MASCGDLAAVLFGVTELAEVACVPAVVRSSRAGTLQVRKRVNELPEFGDRG